MLAPIKLSAQDLARIEALVPDSEPVLLSCDSGPRRGRSYPVAETHLVGNERKYLNDCIDSNWISSRGAYIGRFEHAFSQAVGTQYGVACANGTVALHLILAALGIGPGDGVVVPTFTMIATANAVRYTGAIVQLVDADLSTLNMDVELIEAAITPSTRAIIVVHTYGQPAYMDKLVQLANKYNLFLIEDAAEAHGSKYKGQSIGSFGVASSFSFYANKIITTGEGGMVCTNDEVFAGLVRKLRDHSFSTERHFWHEYVGFNYRMTNMQAAIGLAQVERLDEIVTRRRVLAKQYNEALKDIPGLILPEEQDDKKNVYWMYAVRVGEGFNISRDELRASLARRGIETRTFFIPMHLQPIYFEQFRGKSFNVSENLCKTGLYLPTSELITIDDVKWIAEQINNIFRGEKF